MVCVNPRRLETAPHCCYQMQRTTTQSFFKWNIPAPASITVNQLTDNCWLRCRSRESWRWSTVESVCWVQIRSKHRQTARLTDSTTEKVGHESVGASQVKWPNSRDDSVMRVMWQIQRIMKKFVSKSRGCGAFDNTPLNMLSLFCACSCLWSSSFFSLLQSVRTEFKK